MRLQLALNVKNLNAAVEFYSKMFGVPVNKRKPADAQASGGRNNSTNVPA